MKRVGKCVGKKAFRYRSMAMRSASKWYKEKGIQLGIYECPTCLDFHLTSKYCNLKHKHRKWIFDLADELRKEEIIFDNKWFVSPERKKKGRPNKLAKQKEKKVLTQEEMNVIFRQFDGKVYPHRKSFWDRIYGIIIGVGDREAG